MKNAIVVGFNSPSGSRAIDQCVELGLFECKVWIANKRNHPNQLPLTKLFDMEIDLGRGHSIHSQYERIFDLYFNQFVHSLSREKHQSFSYFEYVNLFNLHFYFFVDLIEKNSIELLISNNFLHEADYLLYVVAKELYDIDIVLFNQSPFPNRFWYVSSIEEYGSFENMYAINRPKESLGEILKINPQVNLFYMKQSWKKKLGYSCLYKLIFKDIEKVFNKNRNITLLEQLGKYSRCIQYDKNLKQLAQNDIDLRKNYVYFPLHLQPELTSSIFGGIHADQLLALEKLSKLLPEDWLIYVKENPKQGYYQRDKLFFKRLEKIEKVVYISKSYNTHILTKHCQFLSTLSGTAGWEALMEKKKVLLFGQAWYQSLPSVFSYDKLKNGLDDIIFSSFDSELLQSSFEKLMSVSFGGVIDAAYEKIVPNYNDDMNVNYIVKAIGTILHKGE